VNIYVETNFILELTFEQEQSVSCEQILQTCETGEAQLIIPAYSLAEPHETLIRRKRNREALQRELNTELSQLSRTTSYRNRFSSIQEISSLLVQRNEEEQQRFDAYRYRLLNTGEIMALTTEILTEAVSCETTYDLEPQDAIILASVLSHLHNYQPQQSCFLNRNTKDFDNPDIVDQLDQRNCRMIPRFDHGYDFIQSQLP
jgi:predicted nucleic acid-binding protein